MPSEKKPISPWNKDVPRPTYREREGKARTPRLTRKKEEPKERRKPQSIGVGTGILLPAPPSEPDGRFSRIRLSSQ